MKTEKILLYSPFSPLDDVDKMKAPSPAMSDTTGEHDTWAGKGSKAVLRINCHESHDTVDPRVC